jgi:serine/threonine protein phosphatase 1
MRELATGDIHGCNGALTALIEAVKPTHDDTLITLGDYIDWGPDSSGVIGRLLRVAKHTNLVPLLGNHEQSMLEARSSPARLKSWLKIGGDATLQSYLRGSDVGTLANVPAAHWKFLESCRNYYEGRRHFYVHANAYPRVALDQQPVNALRWESIDMAMPHKSGKTMVCGHSSQKSGNILDLGFAICIDTLRGGWLTCLDTTCRQFWQALESGELRTGTLDG